MKQIRPINAAQARGAAALIMSEPSVRLRETVEVHNKLLARIARKRRELERLRHEMRAAVTRVASDVAPLVEKASRLDEATHSILEVLAADRKRSRHERNQIRWLHRDLQETGVLSARHSPASADDPAFSPASSQTHRSDGRDAEEFVPRTAATPKNTDRSAIRDLFRRLAEALHPDKVQDEREKAIRTEAMKRITLAYREHDFAGLMEVERTWAASTGIVPGTRGDEVERRYATLVQANSELKKQLREIERELRELRTSEDRRLISDLKKSGRTGSDAKVAMVASVKYELETLRRVHDFVEAFRDGKITLAEFLDGPADDDEDEDEEALSSFFEEVLTGMMDMMHEESIRERRGSRPRGQGAGRSSKRRKRRRA